MKNRLVQVWQKSKEVRLASTPWCTLFRLEGDQSRSQTERRVKHRSLVRHQAPDGRYLSTVLHILQ
jgi:hypothetical protein